MRRSTSSHCHAKNERRSRENSLALVMHIKKMLHKIFTAFPFIYVYIFWCGVARHQSAIRNLFVPLYKRCTIYMGEQTVLRALSHRQPSHSASEPASSGTMPNRMCVIFYGKRALILGMSGAVLWASQSPLKMFCVFLSNRRAVSTFIRVSFYTHTQTAR